MELNITPRNRALDAFDELLNQAEYMFQDQPVLLARIREQDWSYKTELLIRNQRVDVSMLDRMKTRQMCHFLNQQLQIERFYSDWLRVRSQLEAAQPRSATILELSFG